MNNLSKDFKPSASMITAAKNCIAKQAYVNAIRPAIMNIQRSVLLELSPTEKGTDDVITNPKNAWKMSVAEHKNYVAQLHERLIDNGFKIKFGYCPLLVAINELRQAKKELVDSVESITCLKAVKILSARNGVQIFDDLVDITLRLIAPFIDKV